MFPPMVDVLTLNGWKSINDITMEDLVVQLNPDNETFEYVNPLHISKCHYNGYIYKIESPHIEFLTTPDNKMYIKFFSDSNYQLIQAKDCVGKGIHYKRNANNSNETEQKEAELYIQNILGEDRNVIRTETQKEADTLQQIAFQSGISATIMDLDTEFYVGFVRGNTPLIRSKYESVVSYDGMMYSCKVPSNILYVRMHGKPMWIGT